MFNLFLHNNIAIPFYYFYVTSNYTLDSGKRPNPTEY